VISAITFDEKVKKNISYSFYYSKMKGTEYDNPKKKKLYKLIG
jgi:hypothetical protein